MKRTFNVDYFSQFTLGSHYGSTFMPSKNDTIVFCITATDAPSGAQTLGMLSASQMAYIKVIDNEFPALSNLVPKAVEVTLNSGSVYEFILTDIPVSFDLEALVSGPCCSDPYPTVT